METDFRLARITIRGFRGIPELDVDLPERMPVYIIGGNNSGKSTVLDAVAFALSGGGFHAHKPEKFDYFHNKNNEPVREFIATVHFSAASEELLPAVKGSVGNPTPVYGAQVRATTDARGGFSHSNTLIDRDGANIPLQLRLVTRAHSVLRDAVTEFPFWKENLKPKLQSALSSYLGRQAKIELRPDIQKVEEWLTQQLVASFASDAGGAITPLQNMGDGWQSLVRLAALDVLSQYPEELRERVVLLFEEPETHLHPHLRRKLRDVLERLAANAWTVIAATHSPEFVSFSRPQKIVRLWRIGDTVHKADFDASATPEEVSIQDKLDERGNHEFLFAHRAIFCEGKDDVLALRLVLTKLKLDLDALGISFVDIGGVGGHASYAEIASKLRIPWCAMTDEDLQSDGTVKLMTEKARRQLSKHKTAVDLMPMWKTDLEACLGVPKKRGAAIEYLRTTIEPMALPAIKAAHPDYMTTCQEVADWLGAAPANS